MWPTFLIDLLKPVPPPAQLIRQLPVRACEAGILPVWQRCLERGVRDNVVVEKTPQAHHASMSHPNPAPYNPAYNTHVQHKPNADIRLHLSIGDTPRASAVRHPQDIKRRTPLLQDHRPHQLRRTL